MAQFEVLGGTKAVVSGWRAVDPGELEIRELELGDADPRELEVREPGAAEVREIEAML